MSSVREPQELAPVDHMAAQALLWSAIREFGKPFTLDDMLKRVSRRDVRWPMGSGKRQGHPPGGIAQTRRNVVAEFLTDFAAAGALTVTDRLAKPGPVYAVASGSGDGVELPMPRPQPVAFFVRDLPLQIPASHDGLWALIRSLGRDGSFRVADVVMAVRGNIRSSDVLAYARALERAGILVRELSIPDDPRYRVDLRHVETPRLRADGSVLAVARRTALMWRSIKMLGLFTADNLAVAASLPDLAITPEQAGRYADDLTAGGYLISQSLKLYRLKPGMNTGPAAPRVLRARFIWDANLCRVMGAAAIDEVRS